MIGRLLLMTASRLPKSDNRWRPARLAKPSADQSFSIVMYSLASVDASGIRPERR